MYLFVIYFLKLTFKSSDKLKLTISDNLLGGGHNLCVCVSGLGVGDTQIFNPATLLSY